MKKSIEKTKTKKLAKKIAGVTLGAVALGAMSAAPAYALGFLHGGTAVIGDKEYIGNAQNYAVTIDGNSTGFTLTDEWSIYGNKGAAVQGVITGTINAANFKDQTINYLYLYGGYGQGDNISGANNQVIWKISAQVGTVSYIAGYQGAGKGISATGSKVEVEGASMDAGVNGAILSGGTGTATATQSTVTLTGVEAEAAAIEGAFVSANTKATADQTKVEMSGGKVKDVYGVKIYSYGTGKEEGVGEAKNTTVTLKDGVTVTDELFGVKIEAANSATATTTNIDITGGSLDDMYGVYIEKGDEGIATGTTVTLKDDVDMEDAGITGAMISAYNHAKADSTQVEMTGGKVEFVGGAEVYAEDGEKTNAEALNTTVTVNNVTVGEGVVGAYGGAYNGSEKNSATATTTKVNVTGGEITGDGVFGVMMESEGEATATGTTVTLKDGVNVENGEVVGAQVKAKDYAKADTTEVNVTGGTIEMVGGASIEAKDGKTPTGEAIKTKLILNNVTLTSGAQGVMVMTEDSATADDTKVEITGGSSEVVYGAVTYSGGDKGVATTKNTTVTLNGVNVNTAVVSAQAMADNKVNIDETKVNITGGEIGILYGAHGATENEATVGAEKGTEITLNNTQVGSLYGVMIEEADTAEVTGTKVKVTDSEITKDLVGVIFDATKSGGATKLTTDKTEITLNGATVGGDVFGVIGTGITTTKANNTDIIFEGKGSNITGTINSVNLSDPSGSQNTTLTIKNIGNKVGNIAYFDKLNFVLPDGVKNDDAMLSLTKDEDTDLKNTDIETTSAVIAPGASVKEGDKIYLIKKNGGELLLKGGEAPQDEVFIVKDGFTIKNGQYELKDNNLLLNVIFEEEPHDPMEVEDNKKSATETIAASVELLNTGADFLNDQGIGRAKTAAKEVAAEGHPSVMAPFAAFGGNSMKYKSGSHIDAKGWNAALGFAKEQGELLYGIAVEHGQANYDSYVNAAHGEGKNKYTGGVIFAELKKESGAHFDASFRAGRAKSDYNANLSILGYTFATDYNTSATYLGFSIGGGKETKLSDAGSLDLYARYYFTHLGGSNTTTNTGTDIDFKASDSSRLRLGTRYTQQMDEKNKLYAGLAWQYEFAGKAKAVINGIDAPSPSMKGHSGMAELGWKAKAGKNLDIDLGVNGWLGKQRGIAGNIGFKWSF